jgi:hypothetical protein
MRKKITNFSVYSLLLASTTIFAGSPDSPQAHISNWQPYWTVGGGVIYNYGNVDSGDSVINGVNSFAVNTSTVGGQVFADYTFRPHFAVSLELAKPTNSKAIAENTTTRQTVDTAKIGFWVLNLFLKAKINIVHRLSVYIGIGPSLSETTVKANNLENFSGQGGVSDSQLNVYAGSEFGLALHLNKGVSISASRVYILYDFSKNANGAKNAASKFSIPGYWTLSVSKDI